MALRRTCHLREVRRSVTPSSKGLVIDTGIAEGTLKRIRILWVEPRYMSENTTDLGIHDRQRWFGGAIMSQCPHGQLRDIQNRVEN